MEPNQLFQTDALSQALQLIDLRARIYPVATFTAPWGIRFPKRSAHFHYLQSGCSTISLDLPGQPEQTIALNAGDLIVLTQSCGHSILSHSGAETIDVDQAVSAMIPGEGLRVGGGGEKTEMLCGKFVMDEFTWDRVMRGLPNAIHVSAESNESSEWLGSTLRMLALEARAKEAGGQFATSALVRLILVYAVRHWLASNATLATGWLGTLDDPRIAVALSHIHSNPEHPWTLQSLAARSGMSRSSFASRFNELLGESPMSYLMFWRMEVGSRVLRSSDASIAEVAIQCGYESETTFGRAFKKAFGQTPTEFRKQ